ncbi:hypothetical protein ACWGJ6_42475 [Streptomyces canus]
MSQNTESEWLSEVFAEGVSELAKGVGKLGRIIFGLLLAVLRLLVNAPDFTATFIKKVSARLAEKSRKPDLQVKISWIDAMRSVIDATSESLNDGIEGLKPSWDAPGLGIIRVLSVFLPEEEREGYVDEKYSILFESPKLHIKLRELTSAITGFPAEARPLYRIKKKRV